MRRVYRIAAVAFLLIAAFLGWHAAALPYYTPLGPGPGFFPAWLCAILAVLAGVVFVQASTRTAEPLPADFFPPRDGAGRIVAVLVALFALAALMPLAGFRPAMFAFFAVLLRLRGRGWMETLALAALGSFGVFHVFVEYLSRPLPVGVLGL